MALSRGPALLAVLAVLAGCGGGSVEIELVYDAVSCGCEFEDVALPEGADVVLLVLDGGSVPTDITCATSFTLDGLARALDVELEALALLERGAAAFDVEIYAPPAIDLQTCDSATPPQMVGFSDIVDLDGDVRVPIRVECDPSPAAFCL